MNDSVKITARPKLNKPNLIAAWPGIGHVSMLVASYLEKKLEFKKLGEINAPTKGVILSFSSERTSLHRMPMNWPMPYSM
jgi:proteasome assembly chaperone (PAC2) family protein